MQGSSLVPLIRNQSPSLRSEVFCEHLWNHSQIPRTEGLRTRGWKYIRYLDHPDYEELYDLSNDPHESRNLAFDSTHHSRLANFRRKCQEWARAVALPGGRL